MKKCSVVLVVAALVAVALGSCATGKGTVGAVEVSDMPKWFLNPPRSEDKVYGVGVARMSSVNMTKTMAENRARQAIAQKISSDVRNMIDDYASEVEGDTSTAINYAQTVSRTLAEAKLQGTEVVENYAAKDGTLYCLMEYSAAAAARMVEAEFNKNKNEYAAVRNMMGQQDMQQAFKDRAAKSDPFTVTE
jgi:hypothetical protein